MIRRYHFLTTADYSEYIYIYIYGYIIMLIIKLILQWKSFTSASSGLIHLGENNGKKRLFYGKNTKFD